MEPEAGNAIRSTKSLEQAYVMFVNGTTRLVAIYWMDFSGCPKLYICLRPNAVVEINTFRSHAWIFRDAYSGERLQVQRQNVLWARPYFTRGPRSQVNPARRHLQVHYPLRTLRELTLWYLIRKIKNLSKDSIKQLELPKSVKDDLILLLEKVIAYRSGIDLVYA